MKKRFTAGVLLAIFTFLFLETEYLFVNIMGTLSNSRQAVSAQGIVLGVSVIGFLLYALFHRIKSAFVKRVVTVVVPLVMAVCLSLLYEADSYAICLFVGCVVFVLLGLFGSALHYHALFYAGRDSHLALLIGVAYALGLLFQFICNNLVRSQMVQLIFVFILFAATVYYLLIRKEAVELEPVDKGGKQKKITGYILVLCVLCMTMIFAALDNAVTLQHAKGSLDVGQWPRLLLAVSGILAGLLFDLKNHRYMSIVMFCVTLLSVLCVLVIVTGGSVLAGLVIFYLSSGFFVVYFTTRFMNYAVQSSIPALWAGMGRAVNNAGAAVVTAGSIALVEGGNVILISSVVLVLFALISITMFATERRQGKKKTEDVQALDLGAFAEKYSLTKRETEVLEALLNSDDSAKDLAKQLFISRAALYRHISSLNEKTGTKSRIGLIQFYYQQKNEE